MIKGSLIYKHVGFKAIIKGVPFCMYLIPNNELVLLVQKKKMN